MKEKRRQYLLKTGAAVTAKNARKLSSNYKTFTGCLSGSGWAGIIVEVWAGGKWKNVGGKYKHTNNSDSSATHRKTLPPVKLTAGDIVRARGKGNLLNFPAELATAERVFGNGLKWGNGKEIIIV